MEQNSSAEGLLLLHWFASVCPGEKMGKITVRRPLKCCVHVTGNPCQQTLLTNAANKPCQPWERLFAWLNLRLKYLGGKNRFIPGGTEVLQLQLPVVFAFLDFSYLLCLKIRAAVEVLACRRSNLYSAIVI